MMRWIWVSLLFSLLVSLIWWPGMTTGEAIAAIIRDEHLWIAMTLEASIVDWIDRAVTVFLHFITGTPLPDGITSSVRYTSGIWDTDVMAAIERVAEKPYFQSLWALICLAVHRLCMIASIVFLFLPILIAIVVDAWSMREIRHVRFRRPKTIVYRYCLALLAFMSEGLLLIAFVPFALPIGMMVIYLAIYGFVIHVAIEHFYRS